MTGCRLTYCAQGVQVDCFLRTSPLVGSLILACLLSAQPIEAQEHEEEHHNEVAAVIAGTWDAAEDETFLTLGLEYERRITSRFGIAAGVEYLFDADRWIVTAPVTFRPAHGLKIAAGPGFERAHDETLFLFRFGAGYALEFAEQYSIGPTFSLDFIREHDEWTHTLVFGVSVGIGF